MAKGIWRDFYSGEQLEDYPKPFPPDEIFNDNDHCLGFGTWWPDHNWIFQFNISWWEGSCTGSWRGCPCQTTELPALMYLRGLCPTSYFQTKNPNKGLIFTPTQHPLTMRDTRFVGGMSSYIFFDGWGGGWTIKDSVYNLTAVTTSAKDGYALGKQEWTIEGDHINCHKGETYTTFLKLTGCREGEFTCDDGACVSMEQRCDQLPGEANLMSSIEPMVQKAVVLCKNIRLQGRIRRE